MVRKHPITTRAAEVNYASGHFCPTTAPARFVAHLQNPRDVSELGGKTGSITAGWLEVVALGEGRSFSVRTAGHPRICNKAAAIQVAPLRRQLKPRTYFKN